MIKNLDLHALKVRSPANEPRNQHADLQVFRPA